MSLPERALYYGRTPRNLLRLVHASQGVRRAEPEKGVRSLVQAEPSVAACASETLLDALAWHAARHPQRLQVHLYGEHGEEELSYAAIRRGGAACASRLAAHGLQPGQAVAIMLPTGRDYLFSFFGILMAGGIPVPIYPPARPAQIEDHLRRHVGILANCRAAHADHHPGSEARGAAAALPGRIAAARAHARRSGRRRRRLHSPCRANPGDIAFLQYTSGSTGNPKGVVLTHANLLANIRAMGEAVQASASDVFVSWLPLYHDMGLIGAWLPPVPSASRWC